MSTATQVAYLFTALCFILALKGLSSPKHARNLSNLLLLMTKDGTVAPDLDDEIVKGAMVVHDGAVRG